MQANPKYLSQDKRFWADVRLLSQQIGYTNRNTKQIRVFTPQEIHNAYTRINLSPEHLIKNHTLTPVGQLLLEYIHERAAIINEYVYPRLNERSKSIRAFQ